MTLSGVSRLLISYASASYSYSTSTPLNGCTVLSSEYRHLGFLKLRNFMGYWGGEGRDASACQISSKSVNQLRRYYDFSIFQDGGRRHLESLSLQNFIGWRCSERQYASLYQISSQSFFFVAAILQFLKFSKWPPPPLPWIFQIVKFYWLLGWRGSRRISVPNFVKIGQSVEKLSLIHISEPTRPY